MIQSFINKFLHSGEMKDKSPFVQLQEMKFSISKEAVNSINEIIEKKFTLVGNRF